MTLIRPRLTDYYDLAIPQPECDFAIPLLDEDLPLYVDPFLLWKSPSQQDQALHRHMTDAVDGVVELYVSGSRGKAVDMLVRLSECREAGLGMSTNRVGRRIGPDLADAALSTLGEIQTIREKGIGHLEVVQLLVDGIGKDRISDIASSLLKSFLIDFTIAQARQWQIPSSTVTVPEVFNPGSLSVAAEEVTLPTTPDGEGILLIPKRWLRYSPWISYDSYFAGGFVQGEAAPTDRPAVLWSYPDSVDGE